MSSDASLPTRQTSDGKVVAAFVVTPFIAGALWGVYTSALLVTLDGWNGRETAAFLIGGLTFGAVFAAAVTWFVAFPCYLLARATIGVDGRIARIAGAAIGALVGVFLTMGGGYPSPIGSGFIGWLVAAIWWRMADRPPSRSPEQRRSGGEQSVSGRPPRAAV